MKNRIRSSVVFFILSHLLILSLATENIASQEINIVLDQKVRMRDGIHLSARIWMPAELKNPLPAIFSLTPYNNDEGQERGMFFARHGYVYLQVDCRGRGNSGGIFWPNDDCSQDGADIVAWIAEQPWCDGQVAMRGGSYRGFTQWQTIKSLPESLKTIIPSAAAYPGIDVPMPNNIFLSYFTQWLATVSGKTNNRYLSADAVYWGEKFYKLYKEHIPFARLAEITGSNGEYFEKWLAHPEYDDYWKAINPIPGDYRQINIPILTVTGYFDGDQPGAMTYYREHMTYGTEDTKRQHYLIIGPWSHAGTRKPAKKLGDLEFGENSLLDMEELHLQWYDWVLKGKKKPEFLKKRVAFYMMEDNTWRYADTLEETSNDTRVWYLSSEYGQANDIFHSGSLVSTPEKKELKPDVFEYDPLQIISKETYMKGYLKEEYVDQWLAFPRVKLVYHSPPLAEDIEVSGYAKFRAYLELNVPDTDFCVTLYEIRPDGKKILLGSDTMRARYRNSLEKAELVIPGEINLYEFANFYFFVRRLTKGSRIRLILSCLNSPEWQKNHNSGGVIAYETANEARKAIIKLYHTPEYPSTLELPIIK